MIRIDLQKTNILSGDSLHQSSFYALYLPIPNRSDTAAAAAMQRQLSPAELKKYRTLFRNPRRQQLILSGRFFAKWLAAEPQLLIMDEPTRGVDVGAKAEIYKIMNDLVQQGIGIVMISSEMPETVNMCDRMYVMSEGKIRGELDKSEFGQEAILNLAMVED